MTLKYSLSYSAVFWSIPFSLEFEENCSSSIKLKKLHPEVTQVTIFHVMWTWDYLLPNLNYSCPEQIIFLWAKVAFDHGRIKILWISLTAYVWMLFEITSKIHPFFRFQQKITCTYVLNCVYFCLFVFNLGVWNGCSFMSILNFSSISY